MTVRYLNQEPISSFTTHPIQINIKDDSGTQVRPCISRREFFQAPFLCPHLHAKRKQARVSWLMIHTTLIKYAALTWFALRLSLVLVLWRNTYVQWLQFKTVHHSLCITAKRLRCIYLDAKSVWRRRVLSLTTTMSKLVSLEVNRLSCQDWRLQQVLIGMQETLYSPFFTVLLEI